MQYVIRGIYLGTLLAIVKLVTHHVFLVHRRHRVGGALRPFSMETMNMKMKSRNLFLCLFALIAFGFVGYSDFLVTTSSADDQECSWADENGVCTRPNSHGLVSGAIMSLYEWLDSGEDPDDYDSSAWDTISIPSDNYGSAGTGTSYMDYSNSGLTQTSTCPMCLKEIPQGDPHLTCADTGTGDSTPHVAQPEYDSGESKKKK